MRFKSNNKLEFDNLKSDTINSDNLKSDKKTSSITNLINDIAALLIPCFTFTEVSIGGRIFGTEVLLLVAIPFLLASRGKKLFTPIPRKFILLSVIWLLAQMLTDVIRDIPPEDFSRGWARIIFFLINFIGTYLLIDGNSRRIILYTIGLAIGQFLTFIITPSVIAIFYPWKFGYGSSLTLLIILCSQLQVVRKYSFLSGGIFAIAGILNFYFDFRSLALACFMSVIFILTQPIYQDAQTTKSKSVERKYRNQSSWVSITVVISISLVTIYGLISLYSVAASSGLLGEEVRTKYVLQSSGKFGLLLGGRTEIFASSVAIADSPIIGHGSWAKDPKYLAILEDNITDFGYERTGQDYNDTGLIPSHSYILGAWVESGFFGTFVWFWLLSLTFRLVVLLYKFKDLSLPLIVFFCSTLLWNILFSPFGATERISAAYYVSIVVAKSIEYRKLNTLYK
jgi:hypothetical protein